MPVKEPRTADAFDVDLFVIGAGSGGVRAARTASRHGARVAIAEEHRIGGTCVIRGCVPKKLLVLASRFSTVAQDARGFGWDFEPPTFHWERLIRNKDAEIGRLEVIYLKNLRESGVKVHFDRAKIVDPHTVELVSSGMRIRAANILVATGGAPDLPSDVRGAELTITSNEVFDLAQLPPRVLILGGGYIAVEFAAIFAGLGSETTLVHRGPQLLRGFDSDLQTEIKNAYNTRGIGIVLNAAVHRIDRNADGVAVSLADGNVHTCDVVLCATGRRPKTDGLGLDVVGVNIDSNGAICVNTHSQTNIPSIYAVGDVTNRLNLTPVAIREGQAVADHLFGQPPSPWSIHQVATAVFSTPEIGTVGLSESSAREKFPALRIFRSAFRPMSASLSDSNDRVLLKLLVDGESDRIVGAHMIGNGASELIQLVSVAMGMGATKADFDRTLPVHPTVAEELVTMR
jgi:glutathione reductase (NADPH)